MDNLTESGPSQNPEIPKNWNFPERERIGKDLHVVQLAEDQKFIALSEDVPSGDEDWEDPLSQVEIVFDNNGECKNYKNIDSDHDPVVGHMRIEGDIPTIYVFRQDQKEYLLVIFQRDSLDSERKSSLFNSVGRVTYSANGNLFHVSMGINFSARDSEEGLNSDKIPAKAPFFTLNLIDNGIGESMEDWEGKILQDPETVSDSEAEEFHTSWKIGKGIMVITQKHLPSGITKVLNLPLKINIEAVKNAFTAKAPHPEQSFAGKTMVDIPWMKIPELVGAKLSYSGIHSPAGNNKTS